MFARKGLGTLYKTTTSYLPNAKFSIKKVLMDAMVYTQTYAIDALYLLKKYRYFCFIKHGNVCQLHSYVLFR